LWKIKTSHLSSRCDNNWLFDLAFFGNATDHLSHLNVKLQGKNKLFLNLIKLTVHIAVRKRVCEPVFRIQTNKMNVLLVMAIEKMH